MQEEWEGFIHLNINSLQAKINELRDIAKKTKATVIDISESKHDSTVLDPEIYIENYKILRFERNRHGGDVACYIRIDISYKLKYFLSHKIENITFDILMSNLQISLNFWRKST